MNYNSITDLCIVLDIDYTLVHTKDDINVLRRFKKKHPYEMAISRSRIYCRNIDNQDCDGNGDRYDFWGVSRPYLKEFLDFCHEYFRVVIIWSAGSYAYVHTMVDYIFRDHYRPYKIFTHDDINQEEYTKPLSKIFINELEEYDSLERVFMIDDTFEVLIYNIENCIVIPRYKVKNNIQSLTLEDKALLQIMFWFEENIQNFKINYDIREIDKKGIFQISI